MPRALRLWHPLLRRDDEQLKACSLIIEHRNRRPDAFPVKKAFKLLKEEEAASLLIEDEKSVHVLSKSTGTTGIVVR